MVPHEKTQHRTFGLRLLPSAEMLKC